MDRAPFAHLHSADRESAAGRWSFEPSAAVGWIRCNGIGEPTVLSTPAGVQRVWTNPLEALKWMEQFPLGKETGSRWIGFLSYDLGRIFEHLPSGGRDDLKLPLFVFGFHRPAGASVGEDRSHARRVHPLLSSFSREAWIKAVERALDYIRAGDIFQVNLAQRFVVGLPAQPSAIWQRAIERAGPKFGALLDYGDFALISLSPELFLQVDGRQIITQPIKGTRPRRDGMEQQLRESAKDQAELNMIVDLERNDLGRVCEIGSVKVVQRRFIEAHPTVYHGVSTIAGTLRREIGFVDLLRAMFPGGSITGAPKIRAMQVIEELEPVRRGPYCGAIGYLGADGGMQFNVAIRTMISKEGLVYVPVGGGIVVDSDPADEYQETLVKARSMFDALGMHVRNPE